MDAEEDKNRTSSEEDAAARRRSRGGERTKGRADRPDRGSRRGKHAASDVVAAATRAVRGAAGSLLRLTPAGDAARVWLPTITSAVLWLVFTAVEGSIRSVYWLLAVDAFYGLFLILTWSAMRLSAPEDVRRWALAQEPPSRSR